MKYFFITDDREVAAFIDQFGVSFAFIDLEVLGKQERQGGHDTVMSQHDRESIPLVRQALKTARTLVRINPLNAGTANEVDFCIDAGAELLMLPMFRSALELEQVIRFVGGRVPIIPLVETAGAVQDLQRIVRLEGIEQLHFGLNDLRLDLGLSFLFESVANGLIDKVAETCHQASMPFGVGGVARVVGGLIPGKMVLGEYLRVGAIATILSRDFHHRARNLVDLQAKVDFPDEMAQLQRAEDELLQRNQQEIEADRSEFVRRVRQVVASKKASVAA
ncbi:MAG: aldolase/citrate lyase family protein [Pirellulaceae bacterium]